MKTGGERRRKRRQWGIIYEPFFNANGDIRMAVKFKRLGKIMFPGKCTVRKLKRGYIKNKKTPEETRKSPLSMSTKIRAWFRAIADRLGAWL